MPQIKHFNRKIGICNYIRNYSNVSPKAEFFNDVASHISQGLFRIISGGTVKNSECEQYIDNFFKTQSFEQEVENKESSVDEEMLKLIKPDFVRNFGDMAFKEVDEFVENKTILFGKIADDDNFFQVTDLNVLRKLGKLLLKNGKYMDRSLLCFKEFLRLLKFVSCKNLRKLNKSTRVTSRDVNFLEKYNKGMWYKGFVLLNIGEMSKAVNQFKKLKSEYLKGKKLIFYGKLVKAYQKDGGLEMMRELSAAYL